MEMNLFERDLTQWSTFLLQDATRQRIFSSNITGSCMILKQEIVLKAFFEQINFEQGCDLSE